MESTVVDGIHCCVMWHLMLTENCGVAIDNVEIYDTNVLFSNCHSLIRVIVSRTLTMPE